VQPAVSKHWWELILLTINLGISLTRLHIWVIHRLLKDGTTLMPHCLLQWLSDISTQYMWRCGARNWTGTWIKCNDKLWAWYVRFLTVADGWRRPLSSSQRASCIDDASSCSACRLSTSCSTRHSWSPVNDDDEDVSGDVRRRATLITSSDNDSTKSSFDTVSLCCCCNRWQKKYVTAKHKSVCHTVFH